MVRSMIDAGLNPRRDADREYRLFAEHYAGRRLDLAAWESRWDEWCKHLGPAEVAAEQRAR
jgi:hypothetical protein